MVFMTRVLFQNSNLQLEEEILIYSSRRGQAGRWGQMWKRPQTPNIADPRYFKPQALWTQISQTPDIANRLNIANSKYCTLQVMKTPNIADPRYCKPQILHAATPVTARVTDVGRLLASAKNNFSSSVDPFFPILRQKTTKRSCLCIVQNLNI